jgi:hypothetical protein
LKNIHGFHYFEMAMVVFKAVAPGKKAGDDVVFSKANP